MLVSKSLRPLLGRCRHAANYLLGKQPMRLDHRLHPDDVFLVSYPKSGNTWTRFLVANLLNHGKEVNFSNIERLVPDIHINTEQDIVRLPRPRCIKSHGPFDPRFRRVVLIIRDPRDILVSYYHFLKKQRVIHESSPIATILQSFLNGELDGYGCWSHNVGSWLGAREGTEGFMLMRYEDMLSDTLREAERLTTFLGLAIEPDTIARAVRACSADQMRKLEKQTADKWKPIRGSRQDHPFVRSATSGNWRSILSESEAGAITMAWGNLMRKVGYPF